MIFYFTGSGNSYIIAKKLGRMLNENITSIGDASKIKKYSKKEDYNYNIKENEYIGFVIPTYCFGAPSVVIDFIKNLKLDNYKNQYVFLVITCNSNPGDTAYQIITELDRNNITLNSAFRINMPGSFIILQDSINKDLQTEIINTAYEKLKTIKNIILSKQEIYNKKKDNKSLIYRILNKGLKLLINKAYSQKNYIVTDNCIHCSLCVSKCPLNLISLDSTTKKPIWSNKEEECIFCLACLQNCPTGAIQYGNVTEKRKRYNTKKFNNFD